MRDDEREVRCGEGVLRYTPTLGGTQKFDMVKKIVRTQA